MFLFVEGIGIREVNANQFYFLVMISMSFFLFSDSNYLVKYFLMTIVAVMFIIVQYQIIFHRPYFSISNETHLLGRHFVLIATYIILAGITRLFVESINETEIVLTKANDLQKKILGKIFPKGIAERIRNEGKGFINKHESCSVLFADIVCFTKLSESMTPKNLISFLNEIFGRFDDLTEKFGLQKIKTIGDAYMVASCSPNSNSEHADVIVKLALEFLNVIGSYNNISIRIGINSGSLIEGVIGKKKFTYDLWGGAVDIASKMESTGVPGSIQITRNTYELLKAKYNFLEKKVGSNKKDQYVTYLFDPKNN
jgi:class 3 adenylate cyclase